MENIGIPALPMPLSWRVPPVSCEGDGTTLRIAAGPETDLFVDPGGEGTVLTAPRLLGAPPDGDFRFSARVTVDFAGEFDAGVLLVWADEQRWAKLCFEFSPAAPTVVSVVTRRASDDANGFTVDGRTAWLRISRLGRAFAFHASLDGAHWTFVRYFDLGAEAVLIGFEVQAPRGAGTSAMFEDISFVPGGPANLRDGS